MRPRRASWIKAWPALFAALWLGTVVPVAAQEPSEPTPQMATPTPASQAAAPRRERGPNPALVALVAGGIVIAAFVVLTVTGFFSPDSRHRDDRLRGE